MSEFDVTGIVTEEKKVPDLTWVWLPTVDEDGYYAGHSQQGISDEVETGFAPDVVETPIPGVDLGKNFLRWDGSSWQIEAKPTTAEECVAVGPVSHASQTQRSHELRTLFEALTKGSATHRLERGEDLSWYVAVIPMEEKEAEEAEAAIGAFDAQISSLKERMALAMLQGDQDQVAALQAEYKVLMGGE